MVSCTKNQRHGTDGRDEMLMDVHIITPAVLNLFKVTKLQTSLKKSKQLF